MAKKKNELLMDAMEQFEGEDLGITSSSLDSLGGTNGKRRTFSISVEKEFLEELRTEAKLNHISLNALISMYLSEGQERRKKMRLRGYDD